MAISPDKKMLLVAGDPKVRICETLNIALTNSHIQQDFSGNFIIWCISFIFFIASTANIHAKNILQGHTGNVTSAAFQSSMQWLFTASTDGTIKIWDFPGLKCQKEFAAKASINRAVLHPNQAEIIVADEAGFIKVLDLLKDGGLFTIEMVSFSLFKIISHSFSVLKIMFLLLVCPFRMMELGWLL